MNPGTRSGKPRPDSTKRAGMLSLPVRGVRQEAVTPAPAAEHGAKIETPACPTDKDGRPAFMNRRNSFRKRSPEQDPAGGGGRQTFRAIVGSMNSSDIQIVEHTLFCHQSRWREPQPSRFNDWNWTINFTVSTLFSSLPPSFFLWI